MHPQTIASAKSLAAAFWRREFWSNEATRLSVFRQQLSMLVAELRAAVSEINHEIKPSASMVFEPSVAFTVTLHEQPTDAPIAACHLNANSPGTVELKFVARGFDESEQRWRVDTVDIKVYGWTNGTETLAVQQLAASIIHRLVDVGAAVICRETTVMPI